MKVYEKDSFKVLRLSKYLTYLDDLKKKFEIENRNVIYCKEIYDKAEIMHVEFESIPALLLEVSRYKSKGFKVYYSIKK